MRNEKAQQLEMYYNSVIHPAVFEPGFELNFQYINEAAQVFESFEIFNSNNKSATFS